MTYDWFPVIISESWRVPHVGKEILTVSGSPDFTPFGEFMKSPFMTYTLQNLSVFGLCLRMNDLFVWINLTAYSRDLFYYIDKYAQGKYHEIDVFEANKCDQIYQAENIFMMLIAMFQF